MPRRPRPASRQIPEKEQAVKRKAEPSKPRNKPQIVEEEANSDSESTHEEEESDASSAEEDSEEELEDEDADADVPRIVQWMDDEEEWEDEEEPVAGPSTSKNIAKDLSSLSMGSLRTAQRTLMQAEALGSDDDEEDDGEAPKPTSTKGKEREKPEWEAHPKPIIQSRVNKHAPVEVTSKRPVSRKRTVVEVKTVQARDPRFIPLSGEYSAEKFQQNYSFLSEAHKTELSVLRENLKRAKKLLQSSPKNLRAEREAEVWRLELTVKRAESDVNKDRRTQVETEALGQLKKEERGKREQGKGSWFLKDAEKKKYLTKARYDALASSGGDRAVKRAIEKKQKKIGQKEKKSRPFGKRKAGHSEGGEERFNKRRRVK